MEVTFRQSRPIGNILHCTYSHPQWKRSAPLHCNNSFIQQTFSKLIKLWLRGRRSRFDSKRALYTLDTIKCTSICFEYSRWHSELHSCNSVMYLKITIEFDLNCDFIDCGFVLNVARYQVRRARWFETRCQNEWFRILRTTTFSSNQINRTKTCMQQHMLGHTASTPRAVVDAMHGMFQSKNDFRLHNAWAV